MGSNAIPRKSRGRELTSSLFAIAQVGLRGQVTKGGCGCNEDVGISGAKGRDNGSVTATWQTNPVLVAASAGAGTVAISGLGRDHRDASQADVCESVQGRSRLTSGAAEGTNLR